MRAFIILVYPRPQNGDKVKLYQYSTPHNIKGDKKKESHRQHQDSLFLALCSLQSSQCLVGVPRIQGFVVIHRRRQHPAVLFNGVLQMRYSLQFILQQALCAHKRFLNSLRFRSRRRLFRASLREEVVPLFAFLGSAVWAARFHSFV